MGPFSVIFWYWVFWPCSIVSTKSTKQHRCCRPSNSGQTHSLSSHFQPVSPLMCISPHQEILFSVIGCFCSWDLKPEEFGNFMFPPPFPKKKIIRLFSFRPPETMNQQNLWILSSPNNEKAKCHDPSIQQQKFIFSLPRPRPRTSQYLVVTRPPTMKNQNMVFPASILYKKAKLPHRNLLQQSQVTMLSSPLPPSTQNQNCFVPTSPNHHSSNFREPLPPRYWLEQHFRFHRVSERARVAISEEVLPVSSYQTCRTHSTRKWYHRFVFPRFTKAPMVWTHACPCSQQNWSKQCDIHQLRVELRRTKCSAIFIVMILTSWVDSESCVAWDNRVNCVIGK